MDCQNLWGCFLKNFLNFRSDMMEKQGIINLSSYSIKSYASVVLSDSRVTFLGERSMQPFIHFSFVYIQHCIIEEVCLQIFLSSKLHGGIFSRPAAFLHFIFFFNTVSSSFSINCPSLIISWQLIIFWIGLSIISERFPSRFLKCSFHFRSLFLG